MLQILAKTRYLFPPFWVITFPAAVMVAYYLLKKTKSVFGFSWHVLHFHHWLLYDREMFQFQS